GWWGGRGGRVDWGRRASGGGVWHESKQIPGQILRHVVVEEECGSEISTPRETGSGAFDTAFVPELKRRPEPFDSRRPGSPPPELPNHDSDVSEGDAPCVGHIGNSSSP